ncbi:hypothetical protein J6590_070068 [Homalodisca vitripennis]|nr:hypothetical protein J6590_070068 [Homalodisca vitripennis]
MRFQPKEYSTHNVAMVGRIVLTESLVPVHVPLNAASGISCCNRLDSWNLEPCSTGEIEKSRHRRNSNRKTNIISTSETPRLQNMKYVIIQLRCGRNASRLAPTTSPDLSADKHVCALLLPKSSMTRLGVYRHGHECIQLQRGRNASRLAPTTSPDLSTDKHVCALLLPKSSMTRLVVYRHGHECIQLQCGRNESSDEWGDSFSEAQCSGCSPLGLLVQRNSVVRMHATRVTRSVKLSALPARHKDYSFSEAQCSGCSRLGRGDLSARTNQRSARRFIQLTWATGRELSLYKGVVSHPAVVSAANFQLMRNSVGYLPGDFQSYTILVIRIS